MSNIENEFMLSTLGEVAGETVSRDQQLRNDLLYIALIERDVSMLKHQIKTAIQHLQKEYGLTEEEIQNRVKEMLEKG